ncbi:LAETG motif-containing sortase-dependent surface protein [Streptomyces sp. SP18CS02]|uniref:LAETG motif-containing sortase-dependent surface protein n=1 Tax=Streptomyces sp. SP18CS02 TaxID=3002531 RepID=UPI002E77B4E2|nr:LAETG motif-containing sortase-dependent surface protein [Streptomyces sp. SP18CS02]MEE1757408.1 LAETG motif-containing sortase-dependent surface protein [Streptomyces sp. SP18CS02]
MSLSTRSRRGVVALATAALLGTTGAMLLAAPAGAHTPAWSVTCSQVQVDLTNYNASVTNEVTVTVDGKDLLPAEKFGGEFHKKLELPSHDKDLTVRLVVKAGEGGAFSRDETKTAPVCEGSKPTPPATPSTPGTATPTPPPAKPAPTPSETSSEPAAPARPSASPSPAGPDLAETGSSSSTPLIGGAAAAVLVAGGGILWAVRKRRAVQN